MVIANGFVTPTKGEAYSEVCKMSKGKDIRIIPFPTVDTMTYWISDLGEVYGCQQYKTMFLTKQLNVRRRYKKGSHIVVTYGHRRTTELYMHDIMYSTYVLGFFQNNLPILFKDNNRHNYLLNNLYLDDSREIELQNIYLKNMKDMQHIYINDFTKIVNIIAQSFQYEFSEDLCKDFVSEAFHSLCSTSLEHIKNFSACWIKKCHLLAIDFLRKNSKNIPISENEDLFPCYDKPKDIMIDVTQYIDGDKRKTIMKKFISGDTLSEIANDLNTNYSTIGSETSRCMSIIRRHFKKDIEILYS